MTDKRDPSKLKTLDAFLEEEGIKDEVTETAKQRVDSFVKTPQPIDSFHHHEVLHSTSIVNDLFEDRIVEHVYVQATPALLREAERISLEIASFYQRIGTDIYNREHPDDRYASFRDESFAITLPNERGQAEIRDDGENGFSVWIMPLAEPEYCSTRNCVSFEAAVRNIMDTVWVNSL